LLHIGGGRTRQKLAGPMAEGFEWVWSEDMAMEAIGEAQRGQRMEVDGNENRGTIKIRKLNEGREKNVEEIKIK